MQKVLSSLVVSVLLSSSIFAIGISAASTGTTVQMNAASSANTASSISLGESTPVSCTSNPSFASNSCDQCFEGPSVKTGQRLTGLFDNWTNTTTGILVAYQSEQKNPNMVAFGNTKWTASPTDETKLWKSASDVNWVPSTSGSTKLQFLLPAGQKVRFIESDLGAGYTLTSTDKKTGDVVGMLRYPVVFHALDAAGNAGAAKSHYECITYKLADAPVVTPPPTTVTPPPTTVTPKPPVVPPGATQTQTGPETIVLILAAFFVSFGLMFTLRKRL